MTGKNYAIKIIRPSFKIKHQGRENIIKNETHILNKVKGHRNIVELIESGENGRMKY